jgi:putative intracellular protease/amidase
MPQSNQRRGTVGVLVEEHFDPDEFRAFNTALPRQGYAVEYLSRLWGHDSLTFWSNAERGRAAEHVTVTRDVADADPGTYRGLIAIGGYAMDRLRYQEKVHGPAEPATAPAVRFLRAAAATPGLVTGALCHALWLWCADPELLRGRRVTCAHNIVRDVENAGGTVVYADGATADVVVDGTLVTARHPEVVGEFLLAFTREIERNQLVGSANAATSKGAGHAGR